MLNKIAKLIASEGGTVRQATPTRSVLSWTKNERLYVLSWYDLPKEDHQKAAELAASTDLS